MEVYERECELLQASLRNNAMNAKELKDENARLKEKLQRAEKQLQDTSKQLQKTSEQLAESSAQHTAVVSELEDVIAGKDQLLQSLQRQVKELLLAVRGSRQERINPDQLMLFSAEELEELVEELKSDLDPDDDTLPAKKPRKKKGHGRRRLPKNLQREVKRYELDDEQRACPGCGELRSECGVESSEQLEFIPARLKVIQHDRVKYSCQACGEHITTASKPPQPIEKGLPGPGLCAHTTLSKFGDHQPLYRLEDILDQTGVSIRRSTLCGWLTALAILCRPLVCG